MGMPIVVDVRDEVGPEPLEELFDWFREVDARFSTYKEDSEISRLNRGELHIRDCHPDVRRVLARCDELREETGGFFDARSINAGGDIRTRGAALPDPSWRTGIQHPVLHDRIAAVVEANDLALATSGTYIRGEHILDPHTGEPPSGMLSVSITGPDLGTADAFATAAFAMGEAGGPWTATLGPYESFVILAGERSFSTPGFPLARDV
jgi:thiamine biosynthesis lipoprotein